MNLYTASTILSALLIQVTLLDVHVKGFAPSCVQTKSISTHIDTTHKTNHGLGLPNGLGLVLQSTKDDQEEKGFMDVMQPWKVDIPEEVREEIFKAEANTPAAKDRNARVALYVTLTLLGIALSSCNVFLSNVRADAGAAYNDLSSIEELGFGWVGGNPLTSFFLLNKIGGGIALLTAGFGGTMVELEQRTKNETAEKIWKELQRRNESSSSPRKKKSAGGTTKRKKNKKQKNKKRLDAFAELIVEDETTSKSKQPDANTAVEKKAETETKSESEEQTKEGEGIMGKMKDFYNKADQMAASQALLLNKELEDRGVVDKITDETGLNVIGKEAAAALKEDDKKEM